MHRLGEVPIRVRVRVRVRVGVRVKVRVRKLCYQHRPERVA